MKISPASRTPGNSLSNLPGPRGLPLLGNLLQLDVTQLHVILEEWANVYGPLYTFKIGSRPVVAIAEAALIHEVLRGRPEMYRRLGSIARVLTEAGVNGVFAAEGASWRRQRRMVTQALDNEHLRRFFPTLARITGRLKSRWDRVACKACATDVQQDLMRYTVDVTTNLVLGYDGNTLENEDDVLQRHLEHLLPALNRRINAPVPYWQFVRLPADRAFDDALRVVRLLIADLVAQCEARLKHAQGEGYHPTNLLEAMLAAREQEGAFTREEIVGNALTMLVAGEDTTAHTMAWMIHLITGHQQVQKRLQQEVDEVLGQASMLEDFEVQERLTFLEAVAHETMRLKSVAPVLFLETNHAVELGGVHMPEGTALFLLTRQCGLQECAFAMPTEFQPQRWLAGAELSPGQRTSNAFMPFGDGPRFCPGRSLALLEIKAVVAMLCRNFCISKAEAAKEVGEHFAFTMMPTNLVVTLRTRE
ncbi:MAG TPA: cytochrome P450 [Bryobacteraceae bacterium]|nr:cytochrome P450 [Bryobacteraceae bacterium]